MTVHNTGDAPIHDVVPSLNVPDILEKVSGPQPESADIPAGETAIFEWVYTATAEGTLSISGNAAGITEAGEGITSESVDSNTVEVDIEPELTSDMTALLYGVAEGNTIILNLEVSNTGETTLENVTPSDVTVTCTGTASVTYLLGPLPQPPVTMAPGTKKTFEWKYTAIPGSQGGTAVFTAHVSGEAEGVEITTDTVTATVGVESPAILTCFIITTPLKVAVGDIVTVAMTVQNLGQADAVDVVPSELSFSGTGKVKLETGPSRTSIKVEGRSFEIITWMYTAVQEGTLTFSGSAHGVDTATGKTLTVQEKKSNSITVTEPEPEDIPDSEDSDSEDAGDSDTGDTDTGDTDTGDSDTEDTEPPTPSPTPPPDTPPPSSTPCSRAAETIQKVKNLLNEARALFESRQKENRDVRICSRLLYEAELYLMQAEMHLKKGECDQASRKALTAIIKIYEVMNCLNNM